ncbi:MAP7 domain-containing protein 2-like [Panicum virgatum]|uniref:MAP7 domain-containing protein 2-like n=1 Tax=Panicum virgatum TaxID=38727 RepID=UPI0019D5B6EF|nr:MAP7 domain-containing protein 2-like [Panicum virgatum]
MARLDCRHPISCVAAVYQSWAKDASCTNRPISSRWALSESVDRGDSGAAAGTSEGPAFPKPGGTRTTTPVERGTGDPMIAALPRRTSGTTSIAVMPVTNSGSRMARLTPGPSASRTASDVRDGAADEPSIESARTRKRTAASAGSSDRRPSPSKKRAVSSIVNPAASTQAAPSESRGSGSARGQSASGLSGVPNNPDALGVDNTEKDVFDSLNTIAQLPPSPSKAGGRPDDSAIRTTESPVIEKAGKKSHFVGTDKQTEDRPGSPAAASKVELSSQETPRQEVERSVEGLTVVARQILGCHYILADLAKQVAERAEFLQQTGEGLQLSTDQAQQLEKMAALERSSQEQLEKVRLLEARVEALEQDNSALQDKASKLQEKAKGLAKEKKDAVEKLTKIKADSDK